MFSVNGYNFLCITLLLFFASITKLPSQLRVFSTECIFKTAQTTHFKRHLPLYPQLKMLQDTEGQDWYFILKMYLLLDLCFSRAVLFHSCWLYLYWKSIYRCISLQRQIKAFVYNQDNFLSLKPDPSPIWNKTFRERASRSGSPL